MLKLDDKVVVYVPDDNICIEESLCDALVGIPNQDVP